MPIATTAPDASSPAHSSAAVSTSAAGHDPIDDAERERFVGPDLAPAPDDLLGPRRPDQAGQPLGAAAAGEDPEQDLREADPRGVAGDAQVARERDLEPAAERVATDRGDHRPRDRRERVDGAAERGADQLRRDGIGELADVGAGRERAVTARSPRPP